jgi:FkbM family methyltransferase
MVSYNMYKNKCIVQIGAHVGNTLNDPVFKEIDESTKMILVEPVPYLFNQLQHNYKNKLKDISNIVFINKAVSDFVGTIELTIPSERNDFTKLPFWASQLASVNSNHATGHISNLIIDTITVKTTTIDEIINDHGVTEIDLLHTDTEGHDYTILMNYSFKIKPRHILFEHKHMDGLFTIGNKYKELTVKLSRLGYRYVYQNIEDTMFELC